MRERPRLQRPVWSPIAPGAHPLAQGDLLGPGGEPSPLRCPERGYGGAPVRQRSSACPQPPIPPRVAIQVGLYSNGWAARKYIPGSYPTAGNMVHNLYYSSTC